ncbi:MAG: cell division protein FtsL [Oscillospiraceae bacterium]|nr:cell division protein FtsL [Oscillospiraceae bacterium]
MANRKNPFRRIRLVYRRSSTLLKCAVLAVIVLSTVALLAIHVAIGQTRQDAEALRSQAARLEKENRQLTQAIAEVGTVQSIKRIAMEELGLVDPDSEFFDPVDNNAE